MKIFLDTANLDQIREGFSWGVVDGVTTNPSLIKQAVANLRQSGDDRDMEAYIKNILAIAGRMSPVSLEVGALDADEMVEQGMMLYEKFNPVAGNVVIKIPVCTVTSDGKGDSFGGLQAITRLAEERIPINTTLIFTPEQALLAAKAGADYVSPFCGRIDDRIRKAAGMTVGKTDYFPQDGIADPAAPDRYLSDRELVSGIDLIGQIVTIFDRYDIECEVIAASIRNSVQAREAAMCGAHIATLPFNALAEMVRHPGTADGIDAFTADLVPEYLELFVPPEEDPGATELELPGA